MAIAYRSDTGTLTADNVTGAQSISFVTTQPSAGDLVIAGANSYGGGSSFTPTISDNQGNGNYALDEDLDFNVAQHVHLSIASKAGVASSGTFSVSFNTGNVGSYYAAGAIAFSGAASSLALDVHTNAQGTGNVTSRTTGTTGSTSQADEVSVIALGISNNVNVSPIAASGYTVTANQPDGSLHQTAALGYKILVATATQSATWTFSATGAAGDSQAAAIATYKGTPSAVVDGSLMGQSRQMFMMGLGA